jgi:XTP/dITP diphosphohydrolase
MTASKRLLVASGNPKKLVELRRIFEAVEGLSVVGPEEVGAIPEVVEDGDTFEHNARKKAREIARDKGMMTIADDSGLEVDALDGAPGVYSARYAGDGGDEANNEKLLRELRDVPDEARTARFRCVLAIADPDGPLGDDEHVASGAVEGRIAHAPRGEGGFGYDPLFFPEGRDVTMAELSPGDKDAISHRARAAQAILPFLHEYCGNRH